MVAAFVYPRISHFLFRFSGRQSSYTSHWTRLDGSSATFPRFMEAPYELIHEFTFSLVGDKATNIYHRQTGSKIRQSTICKREMFV